MEVVTSMFDFLCAFLVPNVKIISSHILWCTNLWLQTTEINYHDGKTNHFKIHPDRSFG